MTTMTICGRVPDGWELASSDRVRHPTDGEPGHLVQHTGTAHYALLCAGSVLRSVPRDWAEETNVRLGGDTMPVRLAAPVTADPGVAAALDATRKHLPRQEA